jgi:hypothetical protein
VYHSDYVKPLSLAERLIQIKANLIQIFIPSAHGQFSIRDIREGLTAPALTGWYWFYLTPPIVLLTLTSLVYLAIRKEWRALVFLLCYASAMAAPFVLVGTRFYSRHLLYAVIPLLAALAWMVADLWGMLPMKNGRMKTALGIGVIAVLLIPSVKQILLQDLEPSRQTMTMDDRNQYINGWAAGYGSMRAVQYVKDLARQKPVVVITTDAWGPPHDVLWLYLDGCPHVNVYFIDWLGKQPVLQKDKNGAYPLRRDKWLRQPPIPESVAIAPDSIVLLALFPNEAGSPNEQVVQKYDRVVGEPVQFYNNEFVGSDGTGPGVDLYHLALPAASLSP